MSVFDPRIFDPAVFDTGGGGGGGGGGSHPVAPITIQWLYDGDDITEDVEIRTARAESKTNGGVGSATLRVRDKGHTYEPGYFAFGKTLELYLDGVRVWDGYVFVVERSWYFDVDDTTTPFATPRAWTLRAVDRNIHLQKRILFNQDDPTKPLPDIPHATTDQDALLGLLADWVQKSGTGVDWTSGIEAIDAPSEGEDYVLGEVGQPIGVIFEDCAKITGGVYCITPDRVMRYTDDMTVTAPFALSDTPDYVNSFGYRDVEDWLDSNEMANDAMVWGAGKGSDQPVFARHQDADSIADHDRWQWADLWTGAWKEATVRKRARSYVEGSASHRRGHKDPLPDITVTLFKAGLQAGQVVRFIHTSYGVDRPLPIRAVTMTFPTYQNVQYTVNLSLIYDTPYGIIDPWWNLPDGGGGGGGGGDGGGRTTSDCAVLIDEFDRTLDGAWGTATSGAAWHDTGGGIYGVFEDLGIGNVQGGTDAPVIGFNWLDYRFASIPRLLLFRWRFGGSVGIDYTLSDYTISFMAVSDPGTFITSGPDQNGLYAHSLSETDEYIYGEGVGWHLTRISISPTGWKGKTWPESLPEPSAWTKEGTFDGVEVGAADMWIYLDWIHSPGDEGNRFHIDYIRDVTNGIDGPCDYSLDAIDDWGRSILRDTTDQEDVYHVWADWYEWRVISAGPTYAHGEAILTLGGFALDGQFKENWLGDVVMDDGTGNSAPTNPPPGVIYIRHAAFDRFDYVVNTNGAWGTSLTGGLWQAASGRNMMQGVYDGAGVGFPGQATGQGYAYLASRSFADGDDIILVWRGRGRMTDSLGYEPKLFFCGHFVDVAWASYSSPTYVLDEAWKRTRVQLSGTTFRAKTWYDGTAEPQGWDIEETHALDATISGWSGVSLSHVSIAMTGQQIGGTSGDPAYPWSELQFDSLFNVGSPITYGTWTDTGTLDAQNSAVAWNAQGDVFQTRYPYKQGSLRVWIDGLELQSGVEFIETDPENGLFTISGGSTDLSASMQVRYQRLTDSGTGTLPPRGGRNTGYTGGRVYRPHLQQQYGWGTFWDGSNCTAASSAMCLDRHTDGALTPWKGFPRNTPPAHRSYSGHFDVSDPGLSMGDIETAWNVGWGRTLTYMGQISFTLFETMVNQGRGAVVAGLYGSLPDRLRFSATFTGGHAIYVNEQFSDGSFLVYDPLSRKQLVYTRAEMYEYTTRWTGNPGMVNVSFSRPTTVEAA